MKRLIGFLLLIAVASSAACAKTKKHSERGIYVTSTAAQMPKMFARLKEGCKKAGLNTLVIDAKDIISKPYLNLLREKKLKPDIKIEPNPWLKNLADELHKENFILTARIVVFKDDRMVAARGDLGIKQGGKLYADNRGGLWSNPYADEVRLYNAIIAEAAAASGVDEVQFDYIRFPAEGNSKTASYPFAQKGVTKVEIICQFLKEVKERLKKYDTSIAVDIFGVTAWQSQVDIDSLGQDIKQMSQYLDVISPMLYPSHFHPGYDGFANPGSHPYYFIRTGVAKSQEILSEESTAIVPWIQGFNMASPNYGQKYILDQVQACKDLGIENYLIWNARNVYDIPFAALKKK